MFYRFSEDEVRFILTYGRPFSPMSAWGLAGGGPMNAQQIETLIAYLHSIQIPARAACRRTDSEDADPYVCRPAARCRRRRRHDDRRSSSTATGKANGRTRATGEALFNLDLNSGAYSCARCHTQGWSYGDPGVSRPGRLSAGTSPVVPPTPTSRSEADMIDFVKKGSELGKKYGVQGQGSGRMPGFGNLLTDEQIKAIVEYVRSL